MSENIEVKFEKLISKEIDKENTHEAGAEQKNDSKDNESFDSVAKMAGSENSLREVVVKEIPNSENSDSGNSTSLMGSYKNIVYEDPRMTTHAHEAENNKSSHLDDAISSRELGGENTKNKKLMISFENMDSDDNLTFEKASVEVNNVNPYGNSLYEEEDNDSLGYEESIASDLITFSDSDVEHLNQETVLQMNDSEKVELKELIIIPHLNGNFLHEEKKREKYDSFLSDTFCESDNILCEKPVTQINDAQTDKLEDLPMILNADNTKSQEETDEIPQISTQSSVGSFMNGNFSESNPLADPLIVLNHDDVILQEERNNLSLISTQNPFESIIFSAPNNNQSNEEQIIQTNDSESDSSEDSLFVLRSVRNVFQEQTNNISQTSTQNTFGSITISLPENNQSNEEPVIQANDAINAESENPLITLNSVDNTIQENVYNMSHISTQREFGSMIISVLNNNQTNEVQIIQANNSQSGESRNLLFVINSVHNFLQTQTYMSQIASQMSFGSMIMSVPDNNQSNEESIMQANNSVSGELEDPLFILNSVHNFFQDQTYNILRIFTQTIFGSIIISLPGYNQSNNEPISQPNVTINEESEDLHKANSINNSSQQETCNMSHISTQSTFGSMIMPVPDNNKAYEQIMRANDSESVKSNNKLASIKISVLDTNQLFRKTIVQGINSKSNESKDAITIPNLNFEKHNSFVTEIMCGSDNILREETFKELHDSETGESVDTVITSSPDDKTFMEETVSMTHTSTKSAFGSKIISIPDNKQSHEEKALGGIDFKNEKLVYSNLIPTLDVLYEELKNELDHFKKLNLSVSSIRVNSSKSNESLNSLTISDPDNNDMGEEIQEICDETPIVFGSIIQANDSKNYGVKDTTIIVNPGEDIVEKETEESKDALLTSNKDDNMLQDITNNNPESSKQNLLDSSCMEEIANDEKSDQQDVKSEMESVQKTQDLKMVELEEKKTDDLVIANTLVKPPTNKIANSLENILANIPEAIRRFPNESNSNSNGQQNGAEMFSYSTRGLALSTERNGLIRNGVITVRTRQRGATPYRPNHRPMCVINSLQHTQRRMRNKLPLPQNFDWRTGLNILTVQTQRANQNQLSNQVSEYNHFVSRRNNQDTAQICWYQDNNARPRYGIEPNYKNSYPNYMALRSNTTPIPELNRASTLEERIDELLQIVKNLDDLCNNAVVKTTLRTTQQGSRNALVRNLYSKLFDENIGNVLKIPKGRLLICRVMPYLANNPKRWNIWIEVLDSVQRIFNKDRREINKMLCIYSEFEKHIENADFGTIVRMAKVIPLNRKHNALLCCRFGLSILVCLVTNAERVYVSGGDSTMNNINRSAWRFFLTELAVAVNDRKYMLITINASQKSKESTLKHLTRFTGLKLDTLADFITKTVEVLKET